MCLEIYLDLAELVEHWGMLCSDVMCKSLMYFTFLICELATILRVDYGFFVLLKLLFYADKPRINVVGLHIGLSDFV